MIVMQRLIKVVWATQNLQPEKNTKLMSPEALRCQEGGEGNFPGKGGSSKGLVFPPPFFLAQELFCGLGPFPFAQMLVS